MESRTFIFTVAVGVAFLAYAPTASSQPSAPEEVRYIGLVSATMPDETLSHYEAAVDDELSDIPARYLNRVQTLQALGLDTELGAVRKQASDAHAAATAAAQRIELDAAVRELERAESLYLASFTQWLDPKVLTKLYEEWAMVHYAQRDTPGLESVLRRALLVHPTKQLNPAKFPPDVIATWDRVRAEPQSTGRVQPDPLASLSRRGGGTLFVAGEIAGDTLRLLAVNGDRGWTESVHVTSPNDPAIETCVQKLTQRAGVTPAVVVDNSFPPTDEESDRKPLTKRWYFWAGVATVVASATTLGLASSNDPGGGGVGPTPTPTQPPDDGVTIIFNIP